MGEHMHCLIYIIYDSLKKLYKIVLFQYEATWGEKHSLSYDIPIGLEVDHCVVSTITACQTRQAPTLIENSMSLKEAEQYRQELDKEVRDRLSLHFDQRPLMNQLIHYLQLAFTDRPVETEEAFPNGEAEVDMDNVWIDTQHLVWKNLPMFVSQVGYKIRYKSDYESRLELVNQLVSEIRP